MWIFIGLIKLNYIDLNIEKAGDSQNEQLLQDIQFHTLLNLIYITILLVMVMWTTLKDRDDQSQTQKVKLLILPLHLNHCFMLALCIICCILEGFGTGPANIPMDNDRQHESLPEHKQQETKRIQEKKQIDKMMHGIIKERLFGNFFGQQARTSIQNHYNLEQIVRTSMHCPRAKTNQMHRTIQENHQRYSRTRRPSLKLSQTYDFNRTIDFASKLLSQKSKRMEMLQKLPKVSKQQLERTSHRYSKTMDLGHRQKIIVNEKTFKKIAGTNQLFIHECRMSRQSIINKHKNSIEGKLLQRFFHFFGFPLTFGFRQYCTLIENAGNSNLRFIHFWVFSLLDQNSNGLLTSQDLFKFLQRFFDNDYIQKQIFALNKEIAKTSVNTQQYQNENDSHIQQMLVVNHNLRLDQLKEMLKKTGKQRISAKCVKNTCYHQMVLSLEHDTLQRLKLNHLESTELQTKKITTNRVIDSKKKMENSPGLRLRDIYTLFSNKRPRIFCYFLHLLTGQNPDIYE